MIISQILDLGAGGAIQKFTKRNCKECKTSLFPANRPNLTHPQYRADIDGLRAIAVLTVVGFHAFPHWVKGGFIGVDIFFVISGFLISTILFENLELGSFSFLTFYSRRIRRIFPALIVLLSACLAFGWYFLLADEYRQLGKHIAGAAGFVANMVFWQEKGYFDTAADTKPLLHLWSLGVEEQFYVLWPFLIWAAWKKRFNALWVTLAVTLISFALNIITIRTDAAADFYSPLTRFWELGLGALLAWSALRKPQMVYGVLGDACSVLGSLLIGLGIVFLTEKQLFPGWWALLPAIGALLIIAAGKEAWVNRIILSHPALVWFGLISYPLYLWHWPLLSFARIVNGGALTCEVRITIIIISAGLARLTYQWVEKPIRFGRYGMAKTFVLVVLMGVVGCSGYGIYMKKEIRFKDSHVVVKSASYQACDDPKLLAGIELDQCQFNPSKQPTAALIGDSHATDKLVGIVENDKKHEWILLANSGCPPVLGIHVFNLVVCDKKFENIFRYVDASQTIKTVILSFYGNSYIQKPLAAGVPGDGASVTMKGTTTKSRAEIFYIGLNNAINDLEKHGKRVILLIDIPELPYFPNDCFRNPSKCDLTNSLTLTLQKEQRELVHSLQNAHPQLTIYDPVPFLCLQNSCSYKDDHNMPIYEDSDHLSRNGSDIYAKHFLQFMGW